MGPPPASQPLSFVPFLEDVSEVAATGGLVIELGEERKPANDIIPEACFDACSKWLELSVRHVLDAQVAKRAREASEGEVSAESEWECEASMQAIVACATAVEALDAMLRTRVQLPRSLLDTWRETETPRHVQVAEVFQRALSLSARATNALRQNLGEIMRFRDLAVGATAKASGRVMDPELQVGVEWRYVYFGCENALTIVRASLRLIWELTGFGKTSDLELQKYIDAVRLRIEAIPGAHTLRNVAQRQAS